MSHDNENKIPTPEDLIKTLQTAQRAAVDFSAGQRWATHHAEGDSEPEWRVHVSKQFAALDAVTAAHTELLGGLALMIAAQAEQKKSSGWSAKLRALGGLLDPVKLKAWLDFGLELYGARKLLGK
jgi:hypothetical protein